MSENARGVTVRHFRLSIPATSLLGLHLSNCEVVQIAPYVWLQNNGGPKSHSSFHQVSPISNPEPTTSFPLPPGQLSPVDGSTRSQARPIRFICSQTLSASAQTGLRIKSIVISLSLYRINTCFDYGGGATASTTSFSVKDTHPVTARTRVLQSGQSGIIRMMQSCDGVFSEVSDFYECILPI